MKVTQKIWCTITALCLCIGLMPVTTAAQSASAITIGGISLTESAYAKTVGGEVTTDDASEEDYNLYWDASNSTLTLKNAEFSKDNTAAIKATVETLTVQLIGANTVSITHTENSPFIAISNEGELKLIAEEDASLSVTVLQAADLDSNKSVTGIYTEKGLTNAANVTVRVISSEQTDCSGTLIGIGCGIQDEQPAYLFNAGAITAEAQNNSLKAWYGTDSRGILLYGGAMQNTGELNLKANTINGSAYGLSGLETTQPWSNEGNVTADVTAYGGNFEGVSPDLYTNSNYANAVSIVSGSAIQMENTGTMDLTAKNSGKNHTLEYAIGLELDGDGTTFSNSGDLSIKALEGYTFGIFIGHYRADGSMTNSGNLDIEVTTDGEDCNPNGFAQATGIAINLENFQSNPVPLKNELILDPGSTLSISAKAVEGIDSEQEITYQLCQAIQLQKIYYSGDPAYPASPQEIILAGDLEINKGGEYDGGQPLVEFLEEYLDFGMWVYINTIGNYFTDPDDASTYSVPSKTVVIGPKSTYVDDSPTTYAPIIAPLEDGEIVVTPRNPQWGDTVRVTVLPAEGKRIEEVFVNDFRGNPIEVTDHGDGTYSFIQPTGAVSILATFQDEACNGQDTCASNQFADVSVGAWYHEAVDYVVKNGLMQGISATNFEPEKLAARGMLVSMLYRLENEPGAAEKNVFKDVSAGSFYTDAVTWASENGIVEGYGAAVFGPEDGITREQLVTILYRYAKYKGYDVSVGENTNILSYDDAFEISEYAIAAMQWACGSGLTNGTSQRTLSPKDYVTRAQAAAFLQRLCETVIK